MIKISRFGFEFKESRRRWDCDKENRSEWTYEGRRKAFAGRIRLIDEIQQRRA
ncbi:MAG: hypothetical protein ACLULK_01185 [Anaerovoracaceae bacterium]